MEEVLEIELRDSLSKAVLNAFVHSGQSKYEASDIMVIVSKCIDRIGRESIRITPDECRQAIENGVFRQYGDYFGINAVTVVIWIRKFVEQKRCRERPLPDTHQIEPRKLTTDEQSEIDKAFISECIERYKTTGVFRDYGQIFYNSLKRERRIELNMEIWEAAKKAVNVEIRTEKSNRTLSEILQDKFELQHKDYSKNRIKQRLVENWLKNNI